ncbi:MAG: hypothetical protein QM778_23975 [Myxococcales bacterium]
MAVLAAAGCAPKLGDGCKRTQECSVNGDRTCDQSQPGGYCTIPNCSGGSCPDDGVCVRFQPDEPRLSQSWCMASCDNTRDCDRDRYVCRTAAQLNQQSTEDVTGQTPKVADVLDDNESRKFCVVDSKD